MELTRIIIKPYLTEKSYSKRSNTRKQYAFVVDLKADKRAIALAFNSIFNIEPVEVKTMIRKSIATRTGTAHPGYTEAYKIAYITLPEGTDIALSKAESEAAKNGNQPKEAKAKEVKITEKAPAAKQETKAVADNAKVETSDKKTAWRKNTNKNH